MDVMINGERLYRYLAACMADLQGNEMDGTYEDGLIDAMEAVKQEMQVAEQGAKRMKDKRFDAAFGTALENLKGMAGTIRHTEDVDAILQLIEGRIEFLNGIEDYQAYKATNDGARGELHGLLTMILAMTGELEIEVDDEDNGGTKDNIVSIREIKGGEVYSLGELLKGGANQVLVTRPDVNADGNGGCSDEG